MYLDCCHTRQLDPGSLQLRRHVNVTQERRKASNGDFLDLVTNVTLSLSELHCRIPRCGICEGKREIKHTESPTDVSSSDSALSTSFEPTKLKASDTRPTKLIHEVFSTEQRIPLLSVVHSAACSL